MTIIKKITSVEELEKAFQIRKEVFVKEQGVSLEGEFDKYDTIDGLATHILVYDGDVAVGTARLRIVDGIGKLERICILADHRKAGIGKIIIHTLEEIASENGISLLKLHGQTHAEGFYQKIGYQTASAPFMEEGIPHVLMTKRL